MCGGDIRSAVGWLCGVAGVYGGRVVGCRTLWSGFSGMGVQGGGSKDGVGGGWVGGLVLTSGADKSSKFGGGKSESEGCESVGVGNVAR